MTTTWGAVLFLLGLLVGFTASGVWVMCCDLIELYREEMKK